MGRNGSRLMVASFKTKSKHINLNTEYSLKYIHELMVLKMKIKIYFITSYEYYRHDTQQEYERHHGGFKPGPDPTHKTLKTFILKLKQRSCTIIQRNDWVIF